MAIDKHGRFCYTIVSLGNISLFIKFADFVWSNIVWVYKFNLYNMETKVMDLNWRNKELSKDYTVMADYMNDGTLRVRVEKDGKSGEAIDYPANYESFAIGEAAIIQKAVDNMIETSN